MSQICTQRNCLELITSLHALTASYTTYLTLLGCKSALVLVVTQDYDLAVLRSLGTQFYYTARTCLGTGTATRTLAFVNLGNTCCWIHGNCTEQTNTGTVTLAQTTILA